MSKDSSVKYCQDKKTLTKKTLKNIKVFPKKKKGKSINLGMNDI